MKPAELGLGAPLQEISDIFLILDYIPPLATPRTLVQIGASEGNLARRFAAFGWEAYGFDANPRYAEQLKQAGNEPRLHLFNQAITPERTEKVTFFVSDEHSGIGSLKQFHETHRPIHIPAVTLSDFYTRHEVNAIDFFMIDAEQMDLVIMQSHDWSIPIGALLMECGVTNAQTIHDTIMERNPSYDHVVYVHKKPEARYGVQAVCVGKLRIEDFVKLPRKQGYFGNILFHRHLPEYRGLDALRPNFRRLTRKARARLARWFAA